MLDTLLGDYDEAAITRNPFGPRLETLILAEREEGQDEEEGSEFEQSVLGITEVLQSMFKPSSTLQMARFVLVATDEAWDAWNGDLDNKTWVLEPLEESGQQGLDLDIGLIGLAR